MRIVELRGYAIEAAMGTPIRNSVGVIDRRHALVVELVTDTGLSGWGETQDRTDAAWAAIELRHGGAILGADPFDPRLDELAIDPASLDDALATSAIDIALWDLRARALDVPVADLAGELRRDTIAAYASGPFQSVEGEPYDGIVDRAAALVDAGYRALKLRAGVTPVADLAMLDRLRSRIGDDVAVMIDINVGYSPATAAELIRLSAGSSLTWIEEPVSSADLAGLTELASLTDVPLAAGESLWRFEDFQAMIGSGSVAVLQPDLYLCGGVSGMLRIAAAAATAGIPVLPHVFGSSVNFAASMQVAAVLDGHGSYPWFEYDQSDNPLRRIGEVFSIDETGSLGIPDRPGIGVHYEPAMFDRYLVSRDCLTLSSAAKR